MRKEQDMKSTASEKGRPLLRRKPTIVGPTNPPRPPIELMRPIAAAAPRYFRVGSTKKEGPNPKIIALDRQSPANNRSMGWLGMAVSGKTSEDKSKGR